MNDTETGFLFMLLMFVAIGALLFISQAKG